MSSSLSGFTAITTAATVTPPLLNGQSSIAASTLAYTTFSGSSDWTNSGSGKITYTGTIPRAFLFSAQIFCTAGTAGSPSFMVYKNGTTAVGDMVHWQGVGADTLLYNDSTSGLTMRPYFFPPTGAPTGTGGNIQAFQGPVIMTNGDYVYLGYANDSGTSLTNFRIAFTAAGARRGSSGYAASTGPVTYTPKLYTPGSNLNLHTDLIVTQNYANFVSGSGDWVNDGGGKIRYTGSTARLFCFAIKVTASTTFSIDNLDFYLFKNSPNTTGIGGMAMNGGIDQAENRSDMSVGSGIHYGLHTYRTTTSSTQLHSTGYTVEIEGPIVMATNDFVYAGFDERNVAQTFTNFNLYFSAAEYYGHASGMNNGMLC